MADRPMASTSRAGRPRTRSRSVHLLSCIPGASKAVKPRTKSTQRQQVKGKGKLQVKVRLPGKKSGKAAAVVSSDSEDLEVDFPHHPQISPMRYPLNNLKNPTHQQMLQLRNNKNQITH